MDSKINVMFLGWKSGVKDDGSNYYQGQFLDISSNNTFRLYFNSDTYLKTLTPYKNYDLRVKFYINSKGLWSVKVVE